MNRHPGQVFHPGGRAARRLGPWLAVAALLAGNAPATEGAMGRSITGMQITPCAGKEFGVKRRFEGEPLLVSASFGF